MSSHTECGCFCGCSDVQFDALRMITGFALIPQKSVSA